MVISYSDQSPQGAWPASLGVAWDDAIEHAQCKKDTLYQTEVALNLKSRRD